MQSLFCTRRRRFVSKKQRDYSVHIAIDFGTDGLGVAYAIKNNVYIQKWTSNTYCQSQSKQKCIALFDSNGELISFGNNTKNDYLQLSDSQRKSWMLFDEIKMGLYNNKNISPILIATNGLTMTSDMIFINIYKYIYNNCIEWLNNNKININNKEIEWIISIPSIYNDKLKNLVIKWCKSGLCTNNIRIVYESDCASLSLLYYLHKTRKHIYYDVESRFQSRFHAHREKKFSLHIDKSDSNKKLRLNKGDKFMVVDIGKSITNISFHELYNKFSVKELKCVSGGLWGSNNINEKFNDLLNRIFSKLWMNEFKLIQYNKYTELINNFNNAKIKCFNSKYNNNKWYNIKLPIEFIEFLEEKCKINNKGDLEEYIQQNWLSEKDVKKVVLEEQYLKLNIKTWKKLFDKAINPIINHIKILLKDNEYKYLCITGGLSQSMYLKNKINTIFNNQLKIIIPKKEILSVVSGGAYMGITKHFIRSRRLNRTYGVRVNLSLGCAYKLGIPNKHIYNNLQFNAEYNVCHIRNCFEIMAKKGEEIRINQVKIRKSKRLSGTQTSIIKYIYSSDVKNQKIIDDNCEKLSEIKLDFDKTTKDMVIVTEFHFYDTMLKVIVYPESNPYLKKEVELSYVDC